MTRQLRSVTQAVTRKHRETQRLRDDVLDAMRWAREAGHTYEEIAGAAGVTRSAVYQLLNRPSRKLRQP